MKKKLLITVTAVALVLCFVVGGTLAWLIDTTEPVVNTFTYGDINITLDETNVVNGKREENITNNYKMIPGATIAKDPKVTVVGGSEACWLFVKVEESTNYDTFLTSQIDTGTTGWTQGDGTTIPANVYYREVTASDENQEFGILVGDQVTVKSDVTKEMFTAEDFTNPTITFTAYAIQKASFATAAAAWAEASK